MKERLPRTFRSEAIHEWYHGLETPETLHPHFLLSVLLISFASHGGLPWLCQHWTPFLNAADESLGYITQEWGALDYKFPADASRLSDLCQGLASFCDRYIRIVKVPIQ